MNEFLTTALTFPTLPFSILLACCVVYWLVAGLTGMVDLHFDGDIGGADTGHHVDGASIGILARFGLGGVPFMFMLTILMLVGWILSFYLQLWVLPLLPAAFAWIVGIGLLAVAFAVSVGVTALILKPLRWALAHLNRNNQPIVVIGRTGVVISPEINAKGGRIEINDGGAGLIYQVQAPEGHVYPRGTEVIVTHYHAAEHYYDVVSKTEFNKS